MRLGALIITSTAFMPVATLASVRRLQRQRPLPDGVLNIVASGEREDRAARSVINTANTHVAK
jgi:hypothetical protein